MSTLRFIVLILVIGFAIFAGTIGVAYIQNTGEAEAQEGQPTAIPTSTTVPAQPTATVVPNQPTAVPAQPTATVVLLQQGCAGPSCVVRDFDPDRTGVGETNTFPVYVAPPQEVWTAGMDPADGKWKIWFAVDYCVTTITVNTAEHNTVTFQTDASKEQIAEARSIWANQLLNAPNSPYAHAPILYCQDTAGYR